MGKGTGSFFLEKKKEPKKNLSPSACLYEGLSGFGRFMGFYIGKGFLLSFAAYLAQSQRRLLCSLLCPSPCIAISSVSGYRAPGFGFLRCFSPAVCSPLRRLRELFGALPTLGHISEPSAGNARLPQSGCIRIATLAAPAINQSGRGSSAAYIALLYERLTRPESSAHLRAAVCGLVAAFLIPHSEFRILPAPAINQSGRGSCAAYIALLYEHLTRPESGAHLRAAVCGTAATFLIMHSEFRILPAPAINRNGRGSSAAYIALLYEHLTRPESGAYLCTAVYGIAAPFLIPHF